MIVLLDTTGIMVTAAAVLCVWQARRVWLYMRPAPQRTTVTATVVRTVPSPRELRGRSAPAITRRRVIRGEVEPPRQVYGSLDVHR
jgi:hypothetical protein